VLTTKDGFCDTLRSLHLPLAELWPFTFPCWILPRDLLPLTLRLQEAAEASEPEEGAANALPAAPDTAGAAGAAGTSGAVGAVGAVGAARPLMSTLVSASGLWILKPARGSQGEGIKLLNRSAVLGLRSHYAQCTRSGGVSCAAPQVLQPYLRQPLLREGVKWDMRTYVLCTSVLPMRLYVFSEVSGAVVSGAIVSGWLDLLKEASHLLAPPSTS